MKKRFFTCVAAILFVVSLFLTSIPQSAAASNEPAYAGTVRTSWGMLNVRSSASQNSNIIATLSNGSYVSIIEQSGDFYKVIYAAGKTGYCHEDYVKEVSGSTKAYVKTSSTSLNIRSGPSTSYGIIGAISKGSTVIILSHHGNFCKILYNGNKTGYVSAAYLSTTQTTSPSGKITLSVPSFKQYDSRWSNVKLGKSSRTIAQSGCLTTAIAMERSYTYGYTVTPAAVARTSSYTSGGSIYWPAEYAFITGSGYLTKILNLLKQGKPVIVGCKTSYGNQHWVVVTGYTPNGSVTADDFSVNDPGSSTRKTLSSFFNAFPIFYKAAYRK